MEKERGKHVGRRKGGLRISAWGKRKYKFTSCGKITDPRKKRQAGRRKVIRKRGLQKRGEKKSKEGTKT